MAETFKVGANARELLRYTQRATRIVTDDISRNGNRKSMVQSTGGNQGRVDRSTI